jgi:glycosyltransferase involved in cell wall biosynthesis
LLCQPGLEFVEVRFGHHHQFVHPGWKRKLAYLVWERIYCQYWLPRIANRLDLDVLHATIPLPLARYRFPDHIKIVATIHDMAAFSNPRWFSLAGARRTQFDTKCVVDASSHLIAVSTSTKQEVIQYFDVPEHQISVVYEGAPTPDVLVTDAMMRQPFFLCVGTVEPRKNLTTVLTAYQSLKNQTRDVPKLVIAGRKGWGDTALVNLIDRYSLRNDVFLLGYISDQQLATLYYLAEALLYPSFYEGFGLPVIEAMAYGCPVITSNVSSLPEIAGSAAILIDPYTSSELCRAMYDLLKNPERRRLLQRRGIERAAQFSWQTCAVQTARIYMAL